MGYGDYNLNLPDGQNFEPDPARVEQLEKLLQPGTYHFAPSWEDRETWDRIRQTTAGQRLLEAAREEFAVEEPLIMTNEVYFYTIESKSRDKVEPTIPATRNRLSVLPLAEAMEPDGKYIARIEEDIRVLSRLDHWIHPHNDSHREQGIFVDLVSVHYSSSLITADHLLGERLSPEIRQMIRDETEKRHFQPFAERIRSGKDVFWWIVCEHNWNSVCMAEILGTALAYKEDPRERAWYIAVAEKILKYSEEGFTETGFYTEGVAYWNYGFSHYVQAAELVRGATGGAEDWLQKPKVELMSRYGARMEIQDGVYPAFADCDSTIQPDPWLVHWMNNRVDPARKERSEKREIDPFAMKNYVSASIVCMVLFRQEDISRAYAREFPEMLREWFDDVQFLICRPGKNSETRLAATFKGGHNGVNHNHSDLGTFTILRDECELVVDPGKEIYTERTFSRDRYLGNLLNSYGHPVPVVAGELQRPGKRDHRAGYGSEFYAIVLETESTDTRESIKLDLRNAYRVDTLKKLERTFSYTRNQSESVEVTDELAFFEPEHFETALITFADWELEDDSTLILSMNGKKLRVVIETNLGPLEFEHTVIQESSTPHRLAWKTKNPVPNGRLSFKIVPLS